LQITPSKKADPAFKAHKPPQSHPTWLQPNNAYSMHNKVSGWVSTNHGLCFQSRSHFFTNNGSHLKTNHDLSYKNTSRIQGIAEWVTWENEGIQRTTTQKEDPPRTTNHTTTHLASIASTIRQPNIDGSNNHTFTTAIQRKLRLPVMDCYHMNTSAICLWRSLFGMQS
jgi:hypothetical protein